MKPQSDNEFSAFVGIDWADAKHDICLQPANSEQREFSVLPHRPEAIEVWASSLKQRFQGQPDFSCRPFRDHALCDGKARSEGSFFEWMTATAKGTSSVWMSM